MNTPLFATVAQVRKYAASVYSHWFAPETMEWFKTELRDPNVYFGEFFITTEHSRKTFTDCIHMVRRAVVNPLDGTLDIQTVNNDGFRTIYDAVEFIHNVHQAEMLEQIN